MVTLYDGYDCVVAVYGGWSTAIRTTEYARNRQKWSLVNLQKASLQQTTQQYAARKAT
jgi:hypothetical protein